MKKYFYLMLVAIIICSAGVFTSCSDNDDNPVLPDLNVAENIIGKWIIAETDGKAVFTNEKVALDFVSATKVYVSASINNDEEVGDVWVDKVEYDVAISGNKVTISGNPDEHATVVEEYNITAINDKELTANLKATVTVDGQILNSVEGSIVRFTKINADYTEAILGMWEGRSTGEEGSEFDDGENHRWEYLADGTYRYYHKVNDQWQLSNDVLNDYFVAGNLLCTRWKNAGEGQKENREWWEITIENDVMKWTGLRQREDGSTYTATFEMKKVPVPTQAEVEQNIIGLWMNTELNGQTVPTDQKFVYEFTSLTKAYLRASYNSGNPEDMSIWSAKTEFDVSIAENSIMLTGEKDETTITDNIILSSITANEFEGVIVHPEDLASTGLNPVLFAKFEKVTEDYSADIIGTWEGKLTSDQDTYGDGQTHRWEYKADGTYVYYVKDGDNWVPSTNTLNEYFVAGKLLCTRWIEDNKDMREWWEITINGDKMTWTALRKKADGTTFTSTFEMNKVTE